MILTLTPERLAIDGGEPIRDTFLPFGAPSIGEEEVAEVTAVLRSGWIGTGPKAQQFEQEFAAYVGATCAVSVNSCTAGLFLSLKVLGIGPGDEVILPPLTFGATANVVEHLGGRPVFADVDCHTLNIDPDRIARAITPRTKVIMPVHFGGLPCDMEAIMALADRYGLAVVEDAAHAVGARYKGRMVGSFGRLTAFSFYANKNLTTAEGGMITTDDPSLLEPLQMYRLHGLSRDAWKRFATRRLMLSDVIVPGYKLNMPDLAAALGLAQLHKQEKFLAIRQQYARLYDEAFADLPVRTQARPADLNHSRHALHLYVLILQPGAFRVHRNDIINALLAENIGAALHYRALHIHPFYRNTYGYRASDFPDAYEIGEHIISLPLTPRMSLADVEDVVTAVRRVLIHYVA